MPNQDTLSKQMLGGATKVAGNAIFRILRNLLGPQVFNAITGAGVNTRLESEIGRATEARRRAKEIEQQNAEVTPTLRGTADVEVARQLRATRADNAREQQRVGGAKFVRQEQTLTLAVDDYNEGPRR